MADVKQKATNITWHLGQYDQAARAKFYGHQHAVLWFTGLSGSGKSTLAHAVEAALLERKTHAYVLDGDNVRHGLNKDLGFTAIDRIENIRRISEVARLFADAGVITLTAFISPYREDRARAREIIGDGFIEVFVDANLAVCETRDPKGLYKRARSGEIADFTGISAPYEAPETPEIRVDTGNLAITDCVDQVIRYLEKRGVIPA